MPKRVDDRESSPDPLELLPPPRFSPFKRKPYSPHKQLQLRLLELNADITDDKVNLMTFEAHLDYRKCFAGVDA